MPSNKKGYMKKYYHRRPEKFNSPKEKKKRALRNKARRMMQKKYGKKRLRGKDVNHKRALRHGGTSSMMNLELMNPGMNRADNGH